MRLEARQQLRMSQELRLAPQMIQSMEILQLATMELQRRLEQELQENPVLELKTEVPEEEAGAPEATPLEPAVAEQPRPTEAETAREEAWERDWHDARDAAPRRAAFDGEDPKLEAMQNTAARPTSLQDLLYQQFLLLETSDRQRMIAENLVYNIDDNGYLAYTLPQILESIEEPVAPEELAQVLEIVQTLEPPGVGARDLKECLLLQAGPNADPLVRTLIERHLEDVEGNRFPKIARETGRPVEEIKEAVTCLSALNPKPGLLVGGKTSPAILPDVIVEAVEGGYEVRVESGALPELRINPLYHNRMQRQGGEDPQVREYLKRKLESARWLIDAIRQRHETLLKTARSVFSRQHAFLDHGVAHLTPLKMQEVADEVGVHVSTVSRAISEKYAQTPRGIFSLKFFFTGGTQSQTTGEMASWETVKRKVLECVTAEDKANPLSDGDIEARLKADGLDIARRTVTKYRKLLKIPSSRQRRMY
jgi:RNA polymerase sigma-54 factor